MWSLPELDPHSAGVIRIPFESDVNISKRVAAIIDCPAVQRLRRISQLGLVATVYPGATHSRFEHSLGVYRLACQLLNHFVLTDHQFKQFVSREDVEVFLLGCLLHDVGHWPYCHPIEDIGLEGVPEHESLAKQLICEGELAEAIESYWNVEPSEVASFLYPSSSGLSTPRKLLKSFLDGPVDVDKMDYLQRDSLHAGVPYGNNFDVGRLINALCADYDSARIAITEKGKTAAEMMVFARYVMFSEVYWHHAVRSATAMLQRIVFRFFDSNNPTNWLQMSDASFQNFMQDECNDEAAFALMNRGLFGNSRQLYKRVAQFNFVEEPQIHEALKGKKYQDFLAITERIAKSLSQACKTPIDSTDILLDAPPAKLEVQFDVNVKKKSDTFVKLADLSPVVKTLATEQFDNYVKQVRLFAHPTKLSHIQTIPGPNLIQLISDSI